MDNITHSLIGWSVAETFERGSNHSRRSLLLWTSILSNNFPDLDALFYQFFTPGKLGYLLHHRGHTHTLLMILPMALFVLSLLWPFFRKSKLQTSDWITALGLALLGGALHLSLDSLNSYGVHPFWPWNNQWYFGDSVFIVEPFALIILSGTLLWLARSNSAKIFATTVLIGINLASWLTQLVPGPLAFFLAVFSAIFIFATQRLDRKRLPWVGLFGSLLVFTFFSVVSSIVRDRIIDSAKTQGVNWETLSLTPGPANPLCWRFTGIVKNSDDYLVRLGTHNLAPQIVGSKFCDRLKISTDEYRITKTKRESYLSESCRFQAFLKFSRIPLILTGKTGEIEFFDDARYFETGKVARIPAAGECPKNIPPWVNQL